MNVQKLRKEKGITLIALIVTIVVLLILAGISIATFLGENGIINKANKAAEETKRGEVKEKVELEVLGSYEEYGFDIGKFKGKLQQDLGVDPKTVVEVDDGIVTFPSDGFIVKVTEEDNGNIKVEVEGNGNPGELPTPPSLEKSETVISYNPSTWTNGAVTITITPNVEQGNSTLQYSTDKGGNWNVYKKPFEVTENNTTIIARLWNGVNEGGHATGTVTKIDKGVPYAEIKCETSGSTSSGAIATVKLSDNLEPSTISGISGLDKGKCKWELSKESGELGPEEGKYTNAIEFKEDKVEEEGEVPNKVIKKVEADILLKPDEAGTYYLHVLTTDLAGNYKETVSDKIEIKQSVTEITITGNKDLERTLTTPNPTIQLTADVQPGNAENKNIKWESSDINVATIDQTGKVTAQGAGTTTITATAQDGSGINGTCTITVTDKAVQSVSVTVNNSTETSKTLTRTSSAQTPSVTLKATVTPSDAIYSGISWNSTNTNVATVTGTNTTCTVNTTGSTETTLNITATVGGKTGTFPLTVNNKKVTKITVTPDSSLLKRGSSEVSTTVKTKIEPGDAYNQNLTWRSEGGLTITNSSNTGCTASANKRINDGHVIATATDGSSVAGSCGIKVEQYVTSIAITGGNTSMNVGGSLTFGVNVQPSDSTTGANDGANNKTVTWSVSGVTGANITQGGVLTCPNNPGTVTIKATANDGSGKSASKTVSIIYNPAVSGYRGTLTLESWRSSTGTDWFTCNYYLTDQVDYNYIGLTFDGNATRGQTIYWNGTGWQFSGEGHEGCYICLLDGDHYIIKKSQYISFEELKNKKTIQMIMK